MREAPPASLSVDEVMETVAEVLGLPLAAVDPDTALTRLGLESFTAVRLRRRLGDLGLDLPMAAFLGDATARTIAAGDPAPDEPGAPDDTTAAGRSAGFPLTALQTAYWIGRDDGFPLGGVATYYYREYDRRPAPENGTDPGTPESDLDRLVQAWNRLVAHHPMLRMVVGRDGLQRVLEDVGPYGFAVEDLRGAAPHEVDAALADLRAARSHQVRPADAWPLFDIAAAFLPDGRTRLFVGVDVLALDLAGWMQVIAEWGALVDDPDTVLPASPVAFPELVRRRSADPGEESRRERDRAYWAERELPPGPALPWTADLADVRRHRFRRWPAELGADAWAGLRERAAARGLSPTGVLLAAFGFVLARWGADRPFALNTTLFDRPDEPELAHLVGDFTSTILVEVPEAEPREWDGFAAFAARVNRRFWTDMDHRAVAGVEVVRDGLTPVHPVVFTSGIGLSGSGRPPAAWIGDEVFGVSQTPQVALDHIVHDEGGRLRVAWDAVEGLLPDGFAAGMRDAHLRLLRALATDDAAWDDPALGWDPSFLPAEPLDCAPFAAAGPLLHDPLRAVAATSPDDAALLDMDGRHVTHGELAGRAHRVGAALAAHGVGPGDLVAVAFDKGVEQVTALLGVCASGAGYVPVEPSWPAERVAAVCAQAGIVHAVVPDGAADGWPDGVRPHTLPSLETGPADATPRRPAPDDLAYVIFTSGSTGRPKGVAIEHRAARTTIDDLIDRFPVGPDDRVLGLSAFSFDLSVHDVFGVMGTGAALVLPGADRQRDPGHWLDLMERHRVTVWNTAPALLEMLVEYAEIEPDRARRAMAPLRVVFLSGDWIPITLPDRVRALAPDARVVSLGGATEASIWSICHPIGEVDPAWPSIPYGRALRGQSFHILDERGRPVPVGTPGELHIGGDGLARGYVGDERQTAERFVADPVLGRLYRTGDLGRWRPDGTIEFLGRLDRQVKIRGHRIELGEVESVLDRAPGVRHSVALSVPGPDGRPRLVAFVAGPDAPPDERLAAHLRERVPEYMVPSRFVRVDGFPVTANGKVDYQALPNPYRRPEAAAPAPVQPDSADGLAALIRQAGEDGLEVSLRIGAGGLPPARALAAAGLWSERLRGAAAGDGLTLAERLTPDALIELAASSAPPPPLPPADAPRHGDAEVERVVAGVLGELLDGAPVDATTPFFQLGATSLILVRAHGRLHELLDPGLAVVDMFAHPTVRQLAAHITARRDAPTRPAVPAPPDGPAQPATGARPDALARPDGSAPPDGPGRPAAPAQPAAPAPPDGAAGRAAARLRARAVSEGVAR
ncbi:hypothetical protein GCM10010182_02850 [Actinomadura cremea]|nr:hypothetical protein GCM10010182_02850 [Actinomadura cremea]